MLTRFFLTMALALSLSFAASAQGLLPNAKQTFLDSNGDPLAGGSVTFYVPATTTLKNTWSNPSLTVLNTDPVILDSAGRATIYGIGQYRQLVKDVNGVTIWDQLTQAPNFNPVPGVQDPIVVKTNATLRSLSTSLYQTEVFRCGFYAEGDAPCLPYTPSNSACSLNSGDGDNGSQVKSADNRCWLANFPDRGRVDVREFGALADDSTDVAPFILAAFNAGVGVYVPGSVGIWKIASNVTYTGDRLLLTGDYPWEVEVTGACPTGTPAGTWFHVTDTSVKAFDLNGIDTPGSDLGNFAVCQDHPAPTGGWAPTVYQPVFNLTDSQGGRIHNVYLYGVYDGTNANNSARWTHDNVRGQVFHLFWTGNHLLDVTMMDNIHLWVFWSDNQNVIDWQVANGTALAPYRVDGLRITNFFALAYNKCVNFKHSADGVASQVDANMFCDFVKYGAFVDSDVNNLIGVNLSLTSAGDDLIPGSEGIRVEGSAVFINAPYLLCYFVGLSCVHDASTAGNNFIKLGNATAFGYDRDGTNVAAFKINTGITNPSEIGFGNQPYVTQMGGSGPLFDDGGANGFITVGGWYTKTYTPQLNFGGAHVGMTTSVATGSYTRHIISGETLGKFLITLTAKGASTGTAQVTLPIASVDGGSGTASFYTNMNAFSVAMGRIATASSNLQLLIGGAATTPFADDTSFNNNSSIEYTFQYK